ncbi:MSCRAMM family protein [Paramaledivibacter caminithermalis]|jgi:protocatechuate 3,4-dioxygenase beta subunit|uniref:Carboxypeptidase regulatory-like domain-containing protein n=1 Tax=Paramaledivibacter caminithermalis (strain DSM 15212 / CIP 107654 / DViRD3) TaxID=1121301 RepID=A0A1M6JWV1_PARC5|nr:carboxypeptidase-like regulatory domain-containing protein [Paramaledivibacter caminithermalis]SHJ51141.1 Carboxypeptidase regulatory-like domain-containing protein [Paramaledivibacter caminithermalis DSM 15212]
MAEYKDLYKLGQSKTGSIVDLGQEIRIDLELEDNIISESGTVFGKVLDAEGNGIPGVTIKITDTDYNPKYHTITDDSGQYSISEIKANEQYLVFASKEHYQLKQGTAFTMLASQQIERDFVLTTDPGSANSLVAGEVLNVNGEVLEGATVRLYDNSESEPVLIKTTHTNQYGQYAFFDVSQSIYKITSSLLGYTSTSTTFIIDGPSQVRNIILSMPVDPVGKRGTINGIIKDKEGLPIANAYVVLFEVTEDEEGKEKLIPIRTTWTNSQGLYLFEQVPEGNYRIKANKTVEE